MNQTLRVSLSTDAAIYLPFYLAYFGGDFNDTPYGKVDIQIVGLNDIRFKYYDQELEEEKDSENESTTRSKNPRLRGDTFMTLDVLYGVADVGIGDSGFVGVLKSNNSNLRKDVFTETLGGENTISKYCSYINEDTIGNSKIKTLHSANTSDHFKLLTEQINCTDLKIAGGLIKKPALKGIIKNKNYYNETEGKNLLRNTNRLKEEKSKINIFTYPKHSTAYYFTQKLVNDYNSSEDKNIKGKLEFIETMNGVDFGNELTKASEDTICLSCDFVSIRYMNKSKNNNYKEHNLVEDLTCHKLDILWSGFIMDDIIYNQKEKAFNAFFYCIDKVLSEINTFLKNNDSPGLHYYIKSKLSKDNNKVNDVFRVLIASNEVTNEIKQKNNSSNAINLDLIIRYFIKDLFYSFNNGSNLYYSSLNNFENLKPVEHQSNDIVKSEHIEELFKLRDGDKSLNSYNLNCIVKYDILKDWYKKEQDIHKLKKLWSGKIFRVLTTENVFKTVSAMIAIVGLIAFIEPFIEHNILEFGYSKLIGTALIFSILILVIVFYNKRISKWIDLIKLDKYGYLFK